MRKLRFWPRQWRRWSPPPLEVVSRLVWMIPHIVSASSWGGEAAGENLALTLVWTGDVGVLDTVTLLKASLVQSSSMVLLLGEPQMWLSQIRR
jgi:hypothetical protein